jgi:hypothetical protein
MASCAPVVYRRFVGPGRFFNGVDIAGRRRKACVQHKNSDEKRGAALRFFEGASRTLEKDCCAAQPGDDEKLVVCPREMTHPQNG